MARATSATQAFRPLRADLPDVTFAREACLPARSPWADCDACVRACPVDALAADSGELSLSDACIRCGQCASACPTAVPRVRGFPSAAARIGESGERMSAADDADDAPLHVDCWRVPYEESPDPTLRVPCLGGLDGGMLALLSAQYPGGVRLLDRGWCRDCPAGGAAPAATQAETTAREALAAAGTDPARLPRRLSRPLPPSRATAAGIPRASGERRVSRRELFRHLLAHAATTAEQCQQSTADSGAGREPPVREHPVPSHRRLVVAAQQLGAPLSPAHQPDVTITPTRCQGHQVCAAVCPTGALQVVMEEEAGGIDFDPDHCISCGLCVRACPEEAVTLHADGGLAGRRIRHRIRRCSECRQPFSGSGSDGLCPACRKKHHLLAGGTRDLLFGGSNARVKAQTPVIHRDNDEP